jgi:hypothetical protein
MYLQDTFHTHHGVKFVYKREDAMTPTHSDQVLNELRHHLMRYPLLRWITPLSSSLKILDVCWKDQSIVSSVVVPVKGADRYAVAWVVKRFQK